MSHQCTSSPQKTTHHVVAIGVFFGLVVVVVVVVVVAAAFVKMEDSQAGAFGSRCFKQEYRFVSDLSFTVVSC